MIPLAAPPVGLAFDSDGVLYALEAASGNQAILRAFLPDGTPGASFPVQGKDRFSFYVGGMAYDPVGDQLLISDNTAEGLLYAVSKTGVLQVLASDLPGIAGIAVRDSGEIYVSTAPYGSSGSVWQIDRATGDATQVLSGLALGAGLAFDGDDLIVQDAYLISPVETRGRLRKLGAADPFLDNMLSGYSVVVDSEGDIFTTGTGGLYAVRGNPLAEIPLLASQFASAMAFDPGPFEKFAGPGGGRLALAAEAAYGMEDLFVTLLTPAQPGDYNGDGLVNADDYTVWRGAFGSDDPAADGSQDGIVDGADYLLWRKNLETAGAAAIDPSLASVPEPTTLRFVLIALAAVAVMRRRPGDRHARAEGLVPNQATPTRRSLAE